MAEISGISAPSIVGICARGATPQDLSNAPTGNTYYVTSGGAATLYWYVSSVNRSYPITSYKIKRRTYNGSSWGDYSDLSVVTTTGVSGTLAITGPSTAGHQYQYVVYTFSGNDHSAASSSSNARPKLVTYSAVSAPSSVTLDATYVPVGGTATLRWSGASAGTQNAIVGYFIYQGETLYKKVTSSAASGSVSVAAHSTAGSYYDYKVVTVGEHSNSVATTPVRLYNYTNPAAPTSVKLANADSVVLKPGVAAALSWSGAAAGTNNTISGYSVYRRIYNGSAWGDWAKLADVTSSPYNVAASSSRGYRHQYYVVTRGARSNSGASSGKPYSIANTLPSAPGKPSVSPTSFASGNISLSWTAATDSTGTVASYELESATRSSSSAAWGSWAAVSSALTATSAIFGWTQRTVGYQIKFRVKATDSLGESGSYSSESGVVTVVNTAPSAPSALKIDNSTAAKSVDPGTTMTLSWTASSDINGNLTGYKIFRSTKVSGGSWSSWTQVTTATSTSASVVPGIASSGGQAKFKVQAYDAAGGTADSGDSPVVTIKNVAPSAPGTPTFKQNNAAITIWESGAVTVSWTASTDANGNLDHYELQYSNNGGAWTAWGTSTTNSASLTPPTMTAGKALKVRVKAVDSLDASGSWSPEGTLTKNTPPSLSGSVTASPTLWESGNISLSWPAATDSSGSVASYQVQVQTRASSSASWGTATVIQSVTGRTWSGTTGVSSIARGAQVRYLVRACDSLGAYSSAIYSGAITRNSIPAMPAVAYPVSSKTTYYKRPACKLTLTPDPNGQTVKVQVQVGSGAWTDAKTGITPAAGGTTVKFRLPVDLAVGSNTVNFRVVDSLGAVSSTVSKTVTYVATVWSRSITRGSVISGGTISHKAEMNQMLAAVNNVRALYGLSSGNTWSASHPVGYFAHWWPDMKQLYDLLCDVYDEVGETAPAFTDITMEAPYPMPKAETVNLVRGMIQSL